MWRGVGAATIAASYAGAQLKIGGTAAGIGYFLVAFVGVVLTINGPAWPRCCGPNAVVEAIGEEAFSFAHQWLGPRTTPERYRLASGLRLRFKSIIEVLDDLCEVRKNIERHTGKRTASTPHASFIVLFFRIQTLMQTADSLRKIVDLVMDYRDYKTAHGQEHRWTLRSVGTMV